MKRVSWIIPSIFFITIMAGSPFGPSIGGRSRADGGAPQISAVKILRLGVPQDEITAGTNSKEYRLDITGTGFDSSSKVFLQDGKIRTNVLSGTEAIGKLGIMTLLPGDLFVEIRNAGGQASNSVAVQVVTDPSVLAATTVSPDTAPVGGQIALTGVGFTALGNRVRFIRTSEPNLIGSTLLLNSEDGRTLTLDVPQFACVPCPNDIPCPNSCIQVTPGEYRVAVTNANGLSNSLSFLVSSPAGPIGVWGTTGARVDVTDTDVRIAGLCFVGQIPQTLVTDQNGNFNMAGTFTPMIGPIRPGGIPAQYSGTISGNTMTLTIQEDSQTVGPLTLVFGDDVHVVHPCL